MRKELFERKRELAEDFRLTLKSQAEELDPHFPNHRDVLLAHELASLIAKGYYLPMDVRHGINNFAAQFRIVQDDCDTVIWLGEPMPDGSPNFDSGLSINGELVSVCKTAEPEPGFESGPKPEEQILIVTSLDDYMLSDDSKKFIFKDEKELQTMIEDWHRGVSLVREHADSVIMLV